MTPSQPSLSAIRLRISRHLANPLDRTAYFLILGGGTTAALGLAFWSIAAHVYSPHVVGLNSAIVSAMTLVSGISTLGLSAVLVRYLPVAGQLKRRIIVWSYALTAALSLAFGVIAAATSRMWSPALGLLAHADWIVAFAVATAATTIFTLQDSVLVGLRSAKWIPLENSLYSVAKIALLLALTGLLPEFGPFVAWSTPLPLAVGLVSLLIFRALLPAHEAPGRLERRKVIAMAKGNYAGMLFGLAGGLYLPILVATLTTTAQAAYFYGPWMISAALQLVAVNMTTSFTVEAAAADMPQLRRLARQTFLRSLQLVVPLAAATVVTASLLLLAFGRTYSDAGSPLLRLLAIGLLPNIVVVLGVAVARVEHRGMAVVAPQAAHAILVIGLSAILLPTIGITGVGVAWLLSQSMLAIVLLATTLRPLLLPGQRQRCLRRK
jgi:O-antigen/teichoic acid export membrane protein